MRIPLMRGEEKIEHFRPRYLGRHLVDAEKTRPC
jgi:hypothetical protein